jgi:general secretion pathway protein J
MSPCPETQRGFTLIELLIAMTLLAFILTLLFAGLRLGSRSWDAAELRAGESERLRVAHGVIRNELAQAYLMKWKNVVDAGIAFSGETDTVKFMAPLPARVGEGGLYLLSIGLEKSGDGARLVMKRHVPAAEDKDFSALDGGEATVLAEQVGKLSISYFGAESEQAEPQWLEQWTNPKRLPLLVKVRVSEKNGRDWPDLVVAPIAGGVDIGADSNAPLPVRGDECGPPSVC